MSVGVAELTLWVSDQRADAEELDDAATNLRQELLCLDVHRVDVVPAGHTPSGSKSASAGVVGALAVTVSQLDGLWALVAAVCNWVDIRRQRRVRIEIDGDSLEISGLTGDQQQQLIDAWLQRHAPAVRR